MDLNFVLQQSGIEFIVCAICLFYGIRLVISKDIGIIIKDEEEKRKIRRQTEYAFYAGTIILILGLATLIMGILALFNSVAAFVEIIIAVIAVGIMWKFVHEKYS